MRYDVWRCVMWCDVMRFVCACRFYQQSLLECWSHSHYVLRVITVNRRRQYVIWFMRMCDVMWCDVMRCECACRFYHQSLLECWSHCHYVVRVITVHWRRQYEIWFMRMCDVMWCDVMRCECACRFYHRSLLGCWSHSHYVLRVITVNRRRQYEIWCVTMCDVM